MTGPLAGRTVLLTRDEGLASEVRRLGASVRVVSLLRYEAIPAPVDLSAYDWVVFTSRRAVDFLGPGLENARRIACVGPSAAEAVRGRGGEVDLVPERHDAGALVEEMIRREALGGRRVLFPCSDRALGTIEGALGEAGARVDRLEVYRGVPAASLSPDATEGVDVVVFLAPSAVETFAALGGDLGAAPALAIGPTTAGALRERGIRPVTAPTADRAGLVQALRRWEWDR